MRWRYVDNLGPLLSYKLSAKGLSPEAARVLTDLNRNGVALTLADTLLGSKSCYRELATTAENLQQRLASELAKARPSAQSGEEYKNYIFELLGDRPRLDPDDIFVRFALQEPILQIANSYFGMYTRLRFYNVWHTFATALPPRQSQLWHRDPEDNHVLKIFLYLSDVDDRAGPFCYASGTHLKGALRRDPAYTREKGDAKRSSDAQLAQVVPPERWVKAVGSKGTMIFADTRGFHKGGLARARERVLYTCMFTSPATKVLEQFERPEGIAPLPELDKAQLFALGL